MALQHSEDDDRTIYKVVVNHEEQYSIWPEYKENAPGWNDAGKVGTKADCLAYIKEVWTDMRPLSLRKKMEELARNPPPAPPPSSQSEKRESLVDRLSAGDQPLTIALRPDPSVKAFKEAMDGGYLRVKFTNTKGGTELGFKVDKDASDLSEADFNEGTGQVRVVGGLSLDYTNVRCIANIDLQTLAGVGHLEKVEAADVAQPLAS
jgi:uncharacterized protein YbdZ (MbtH family)